MELDASSPISDRSRSRQGGRSGRRRPGESQQL